MNQISPPDTVAEVQPRRRGFTRFVLLVLVPIVALLAGLGWWLSGGGSVSTDDAYVKADKIMVAPQISGRVVRVGVAEDELVEAGRPLFLIDPEPLRIALARTDADLAAARNEVEALRAQYRQRQAELRSGDETVAWLEREVARQQKLGDVVSRAQLDELVHRLRAAREERAAKRQALAATLESLGGDPDRPADQHPKVQAAAAARERAALDLRDAEVVAPAAGIVTKFDLQPGEWVQAGQSVFAMVGAERNWIEANFKETQLGEVRVGQEAQVTLDTYPGRAFKARVASISPATGTEFALLPAQNATGNWVKVVQRVPVRVVLDPGQDVPPLRAGMSATVEIATGAPQGALAATTE